MRRSDQMRKTEQQHRHHPRQDRSLFNEKTESYGCRDHRSKPPELAVSQSRSRHAGKFRRQSQSRCCRKHHETCCTPEQTLIEIHRLASDKIYSHQQKCESNTRDDVRTRRVESPLHSFSRKPFPGILILRMLPFVSDENPGLLLRWKLKRRSGLFISFCLKDQRDHQH